MLLFGLRRHDYFPDAWIQAGRFRGKDKAQIEDHAEIRSYPIASVEEAVAFVRKHSLRGADIGAVRRKERWNLPPAAVREAIVNAVVHADYAQRGAPIRVSTFDDRCEVDNPGLLPFGLTIDDLLRGVSKLRNRVMGRVFRDLGLIEQWGSGIQRMTAACLDAGLEPPVLEELGVHFRVTIRTEARARPLLDAVDEAILAALASGHGLSTGELAGVIELTSRATRNRLVRLVGRGLVREISTGPNDPKRRYHSAI
jgi:predicted HTH transcriptional regulator